jgi:hypothetical protein
MRSTIGPNVTVGEGTNVMPGTVLLESVGAHRLVAGNPAKLINIPLIRRNKKKELNQLAMEILQKYREYVNENKGVELPFFDGVLDVGPRHRRLKVSVNGDSDIVLLTRASERTNGIFFNLADLTTDSSSHPAKRDLEAYMRLYYGLTFL